MSEENETPAAQFQPGDKVLVNGGLVGVIDVYDVATDVLVVTSKAGGSPDRATYHISQTRLQHIVTDVVTSDDRPAEPAPEVEQPELPLEPVVEPEPTSAKGAK